MESASQISTSEANARHARTIVDRLLAQGVRDAVISPGSRNTPLVLALDAAARQRALRIHVVLDERVAGFFALGVARRTCRPIALSCSSGSAGGHYLPAVMEAQRSGICLIALTADRPQELHRTGAPQTTEQRALYAEHVHETLCLSAPDTDIYRQRATAQAIERAVAGARGARAPVHINIAFREPLWDVRCTPIIARAYGQPTPRIFPPQVLADVDGLRALRALKGRGLFVVGPIDAGRYSDTERSVLSQTVIAAAQRLDWPIAAGAVSPLHHRDLPALMHIDILSRTDAPLELDGLEHVVMIGPWPTSKAWGQWLSRHPEIEVTSLPGELDAIDPWDCVDRCVRGDLQDAIRAVGADSAPQSAHPILTHAVARDRAMDRAIGDFCAAHPRFEGSIARAIVDAAGGPLSLHIASSMPIRDVDAYARGVAPDVTLCASRGVNGIDGNISTTIGEAIGAESPAAILMGDLAFRHDIGGLAHARNLDITLTIVVIDNSGGGIFRHLGISEHSGAFESYFLTPQRSEIAALAAGCGARVQCMDDACALVDAFQRAQHRPGVDVLCIGVPGDQQPAWRRAANAAALGAATRFSTDHR